ncbi:GatB/YqeY domain-containing protein [Litorimonas haliclonae]|uniref:GatB/YqeY domain-containing protein n=1 Tax=Litorimonas haliclonae TaxID=2081977 RepID=UPI0039EF918F
MPVAATPLRDKIGEETKTAMRAKDTVRLSTLRLISAAIKDRDIAARAEDRCEGISDSEILSILSKMVKQREESAKTYEDNGRPELAEREKTEISIIRDFMPKPLSEDEMKDVVAQLVEDSGATCLKDMGKIMGQLKSQYAGRIDMGKAGAIVKSHLCR